MLLFLIDLINIEKIENFVLFLLFAFFLNFIILRSRATSQSLLSFESILEYCVV